MALGRFLGLAKPQFFHLQNGNDEYLLYRTMWVSTRLPVQCRARSNVVSGGSSWLSLVPCYTCLLLSFLPFPASLYSFFFFFFCPMVNCLKPLLKSDEVWKNKWKNKVNTIIANRHTCLNACLFFPVFHVSFLILLWKFSFSIILLCILIQRSLGLHFGYYIACKDVAFVYMCECQTNP